MPDLDEDKIWSDAIETNQLVMKEYAHKLSCLECGKFLTGEADTVEPDANAHFIGITCKCGIRWEVGLILV